MWSFLTFCTLADIGVAQLWKHGTVLGSAVEHAAPPVCAQGTKQSKAYVGELSWKSLYSTVQTAAQIFPDPERAEHWGVRCTSAVPKDLQLRHPEHSLAFQLGNSLRLLLFSWMIFVWAFCWWDILFVLCGFSSYTLPSLHPPIPFLFFVPSGNHAS